MSGEGSFRVEERLFALFVGTGVNEEPASDGRDAAAVYREHLEGEARALRQLYERTLPAIGEAIEAVRRSGHISLVPLEKPASPGDDVVWSDARGKVQARKWFELSAGDAARLFVRSPEQPHTTHRFELEISVSEPVPRAYLDALSRGIAALLWPDGREPGVRPAAYVDLSIDDA